LKQVDSVALELPPTRPGVSVPGLALPHAAHAAALPHRAVSENGQGSLNEQVYNRLLRSRIIFLGSMVDDDIANAICAQLLLLAAEDPDKDINLYINSPGGSVSAGLAMYDTMQYIKNDVVTIGMGLAASMGQFLLTAGTPGKRFALPNTEILMHQGSAGIGGSASDIKIQVERQRRSKMRMTTLTAQHTGQSVETIERDSDRDKWFTAEEAKEYGLIDEIMHSASDLPGGGGVGQ
jgi:ATP-dependent Clp protease protease subunit